MRVCCSIFRPQMLKLAFVAVLTALLLTGCGSGKKKPDENENLSAQQFYSIAKDELNSGNYNEAILNYQQLEARYPYGRYAEQAQIDVAYAHYKNDSPELALAAVERFIRLHPTHERVDYAYYLRGLASFTEDDSLLSKFAGTTEISERDPKSVLEAFNSFKELVTRFPNSRYVDDARQRMAYLLNGLAQHDINVARYYLKHGAYVAVLGRAKYVVENYQTTPSVEEALGLMATAYREMGMRDLQADTLRVLKENFPDSIYLSQLSN